MKRMNLFFWIYLMMGCSGIPEIPESEIGYIDYSFYPQEEFSQNDRILLKNVEFEEGILSCSISLKSALELGIPEKKYNYFLEYIQNENQRLEKYLESGAIVFYNGEPFTRNKELYKYIENKEESLSRATYSQAGIVWSRQFGYDPFYIPIISKGFEGPSKISASFTGTGNFELQEKSKKIIAYLVGNERTATFKWGFGNKVWWSWEMKYFGTPSSSATLNFTGHWKDPMPEFPPSDFQSEKFWWNNMPSYVHLTHNKLSDYIEVNVETVGDFSAQVYKKVNKDYVLYDYLELFSGYTRPRVSTPPSCTFWIVIYRKKMIEGKTSWTYLGDMEYQYPLHWMY